MKGVIAMQISTWALEEKLSNCVHLHTQEEKICHILHVLDELAFCDAISFFRYSPIGYVGEGIAGLQDGQLQSLSYIRDDLRSLPIVKNAVEKRKTTFHEGREIITLMSSRYHRSVPLKGLLVIPIVVNNMTIAYICCEFIKKLNHFKDNELEQFTLFGRLIGELFIQPQTIAHPKLSPRENQVLRALANGLSTKELTNLLALSEATVKQYIKSVLVKLGAKNRTHAVSIYLGQNL
ncbi:helix-turn-helix transcriptional regulator [Ureibacillus chungkukjangi]|uniref:response regulator transcription factor n=1 Tax=Ureibacillus chungkukjangi TaxID=1202712 RepID=UPI002040ECB0|nr:helix-turn-helix transcriptional regulator [Ureibacillus chungkukjangi]MCM3390168.1 helix-turn-helix transcriptional regulator [Ureibacillus chungkukjangi]